MNAQTVSPLRLEALGMEARAVNLFRMFLQGPCQNRAVLVEAGEAEAYLVDLDSLQGAKSFAAQRQSHPHTTFIVLSLQPPEAGEGIVFVQKPLQSQGMLAAIEQARAAAAARQVPPAPHTSADADVPGMKVITAPEKANASTHQVAMLLDEQGFGSYFGQRENIDPSDPAQRATAYYVPDKYLQGHVQAACRLAFSQQQAIRVETPWKSVTILPHQRLVWVDAEEAQLRAACAVPFRKFVSLGIGDGVQAAGTVEPLDANQIGQVLSRNNLTPIDTFLWKIALWTSKGRISCGVDLNQAVRLKRWPNFTRVLVTPHALRIAALLHRQPCSLIEAARILGVRQQYVFAFFSAAHAQGLTELQPPPEVRRQAAEPPPPPLPDKPERTSLLRNILKRLKMDLSDRSTQA